jgi:hypothetical protein
LVIHLLLWYILIKFWIVTWDTRHLNLKWVKISVPILLMITYILFIRLKDIWFELALKIMGDPILSGMI